MSDQYATLEEADLYLESVLDTEPWDYSTDIKRTKALKQATRMIQALNIPTFEAPIPQDIINATVAIAIRFLDGYDPELELENASVASMTFGSIKQANKLDEEIPLHVLAGIPSAYAFNILKRYMPDLTTVRLNRID